MLFSFKSVRLTLSCLAMAYSLFSLAAPFDGPAYGPVPGQAGVIQSDMQRTPQIEIFADVASGSTLLQETDYVGEGQFPLTFVRYHSSPNGYSCNPFDWTHNYSSCITTHSDQYFLDLNFVDICTLGACTRFIYDQTKPNPTFGYDYKPRLASVRDNLEREKYINGTKFAIVYTHFNTGIREGYSSEGRLLSRFDRSGIEHRLTYDTSGHLETVVHVPSGRRLQFGYTSLQLHGRSGSLETFNTLHTRGYPEFCVNG